MTFLGFGEAGTTFASAPGWRGTPAAYDLLTAEAANHAMMTARYRQAGVDGRTTVEEALNGATVVISVVTADQALIAASSAAGALCRDALYFDMNSVAPDTKREAARVIEAAGGHYVDVAVMAPVHPERLAVPLLLSGPHSDVGKATLASVGFTNVRAVPGEVGRASSVKMIRSVMVKGIEALTAEMLLASEAAGVTEEVLASLGDARGMRADYNLGRMLVHGTRRAAEMREVAKMLDLLGVAPAMTLGTIRRQSELGVIGAGSPEGLTAKLGLIA